MIKSGKATSDTYLKKGIFLKETHKLQQAMECFESAIELNPDSFPAIYHGALLLFDTEQFETAKTWFEGARDCTMKFDERNLALIGLASTLEKLKEYPAVAMLYKHEGFATKLEELMGRLEGRELDMVVRKLEEAEKDSLEYESDIDLEAKGREEKKEAIKVIDKVEAPKRPSVPNPARGSIKMAQKP